MKTAARNVLFALLLLAPAVCFAADQVRDLLAYGTDQILWSADVVSGTAPDAPPVDTIVRYRTPGDQMQWKQAAELGVRPMSLAGRGNELLVVLDDGEWKIIATDGARSGLALPNDARVLALAGDVDDIWALGARGSGPDPATTSPASTLPVSTGSAPAIPAPATSASTAPAAHHHHAHAASSAAPATQPTPIGLFQLHRGTWKDIVNLPTDVSPEQVVSVSLAIIESRPTLALISTHRGLRIYTLNDGAWSAPQNIPAPDDAPQIKLLDVRGRAAIWIADTQTPGVLHFRENGVWGPPIQLASSPSLASFDRMSLTAALGQLRMIASDGKGHLAEQLYTADGKLLGKPNQGVTQQTDAEKRLSQSIQFIVLAVLVIWMFGAMKQRPNLQEAMKRVPTLNLAPIGRRLLGGLIDMIPIFAGAIVSAILVSRGSGGAAENAPFTPEFAWIAAGIAVYFLHVTICELIFHRSIGKMIARTRIAALDGTPIRSSQILIRNVLRVVDLALMLVPLLSVLSPLRQRVGDMTAGTIVISTDPPAVA